MSQIVMNASELLNSEGQDNSSKGERGSTSLSPVKTYGSKFPLSELNLISDERNYLVYTFWGLLICNVSHNYQIVPGLFILILT